MNTTTRNVLIFTLLVSSWARAVDLSKMPQLHETKEQRDERMQWFRDAKFGLFIHWSPVSIQGTELSWSRNGKKPLDVTNDPAGPIDDPVYDNLYKQFNPTKYNAKQWVKIAQDAGMKYMVLTCKHHEGFAMFHTKFRPEFSIAATPFKRDVVKELADACHEAGMRFGVYYSPRDWTHPDYGIGDNKKYVKFMNGQLRELLTNYGKVDIIWFDSYGHGDLEKFWQIGETWSLLKSLQPAAVINNRLAVLAAYNQQPAPYRGDYDTPEQSIGRMQTDRAWESCICFVGGQWSYRPNGEMQGFSQVVRDLVSCVTGDGNLLLDVGPMPTGEIEPRQTDRLKEVGDWLKKYGEAVYGTRGGPYRNGTWGGSCHKGNKLYLHISEWPVEGLGFDPLSNKVIAARTLTGAPVTIKQNADEFAVEVARKDREKPVTVIELTLEKPVESGRILGAAHAPKSYLSEHGALLSEKATLEISSRSGYDDEKNHARLFSGDKTDYAFHTDKEKNPWAKVDLGAVKTVNAVVIENCLNERRAEGLILSFSEDGQKWEEIWRAKTLETTWVVPVTHFDAGINAPGRRARFIRAETRNEAPRELLLRRITVFGVK
jgi:alpha-L-fucosidase